jgi:hypothetical protein
VRPDLAYSLATNKLNVNFEKESSSKEDKKYVLQDSTFSIQRYEIKNGESFYFRYRFQNDYQVGGCLSNRINHRVSYNKANIANIDMQFHYSGTFVDTSSILIADEFMETSRDNH